MMRLGWEYKKFCKRCGVYNSHYSKNSKICVVCVDKSMKERNIRKYS